MAAKHYGNATSVANLYQTAGMEDRQFGTQTIRPAITRHLSNLAPYPVQFDSPGKAPNLNLPNH